MIPGTAGASATRERVFASGVSARGRGPTITPVVQGPQAAHVESPVMALATGTRLGPYQTLISSLLHKYASGRRKEA